MLKCKFAVDLVSLSYRGVGELPPNFTSYTVGLQPFKDEKRSNELQDTLIQIINMIKSQRYSLITQTLLTTQVNQKSQMTDQICREYIAG